MGTPQKETTVRDQISPGGTMPKPPKPSTPESLAEVLRLQRLTITLLTALEGREAVKIDEVLVKLEETKTEVAGMTSVVDSAVAVLNTLTGLVGDLKNQLADAIASQDPTKLQAALEAVAAIETGIDQSKQKLADAVVASTPGAPPTP